MTPLEHLEKVTFEATADISAPLVRMTVRGIVRALAAVLRDLDRRLAAVEEKNRHG